MEDKLPISNIPLIFTKYRTRILEESGQQWFHSENNPNDIVESAFVTSSFDDFGDAGDVLPDLTAPTPATPTPATPTPTELSQGIPSTLNPPTPYDYPDPWEPSSQAIEYLDDSASGEPLSVSIGDGTQANEESSDNPEIVIRHPQKPQTNPVEEGETSVVESAPSLSESLRLDSISGQSAKRVNLFPFEREDSPDLEITGIYDLTEFDNGELEVPPVAVRESQPAKFEKVHRPQASAPTQNAQDNDIGDDPSLVDPKTLSSAELAKHRLRNCL